MPLDWLPSCFKISSKPSFKLLPEFQTIKRLGRGMEGEVWLCREIETNELVAIKLIPRGAPAWQLAMVEHEISIMLELGACHPNIVHPRELVLTPTHLGLVQEYMNGGTLGDFLQKHKVHLDEPLACYFFRQLIAAVEFCHKHRIAYRDIKLENTLLDRSDPPRIVACDFGTAKKWAKRELPVMYSITGTPGYIPPEIMEAAFNDTTTAYDATKSDVWQCGVLLCLLLMHHFPYDFDEMVKAMPPAHALRMLLKLEKTRSWSTATGDADKLSADARDLLDRIFQPETKSRITIAGIKSHPWFNQRLPDKYARALLRQQQVALQAQRAAQLGMRRAHSQSALQLLAEEPGEEEVQAAVERLEREQQAALRVQLSQQLQQQRQLSQHLQAQRQLMLGRDSPIRKYQVQDEAQDVEGDPQPRHRRRQAQQQGQEQQAQAQQKPQLADTKAVMKQVSAVLDSARTLGLPTLWGELKRVSLQPSS